MIQLKRKCQQEKRNQREREQYNPKKRSRKHLDGYDDEFKAKRAKLTDNDDFRAREATRKRSAYDEEASIKKYAEKKGQSSFFKNIKKYSRLPNICLTLGSPTPAAIL